MTGATGQAAPSGATGAAPTGATGGTGATGAAKGTGATGVKDSRLSTVKIPAKYEKEPWAKEVTSVDDLWDKMSGLNKVLGKERIALPGDSATTEEMSAFYTRMGRPTNPEGYEFKPNESMPDVERNVEMDNKMKTILFNRGLSKEAAEGVVADYENLIVEMTKPAIEANTQRDTEFSKLADEVLGADKASAMEAFKVVMRESLGDKAHLASKIETMSNDELMPLIVLAKNLHDKYSGETRVMGAGRQGNLSGDLKTDFQALSAQKIAIKNDNNMSEHIKKMKLANINTEMMKIGSKAKDQDINLFAN